MISFLHLPVTAGPRSFFPENVVFFMYLEARLVSIYTCKGQVQTEEVLPLPIATSQLRNIGKRRPL